MKSPLIIANWKSNKTVDEAKKWFEEIASQAVLPRTAQVVLCPSFPLLPVCQDLLTKYRLPWKLGAQTVSSFSEGKHTGEVNAVQLKEYVSYVLIGHSERRMELHETNDMLFEKVKRVREAGLTPIYFVQDGSTTIPEGVDIVAYEPIFAIGTGVADTPEHAEQVARGIKISMHIQTVLYGGSVDDKNVAAFMSCSSLDGIVPGAASLNPKEFAKLIIHA